MYLKNHFVHKRAKLKIGVIEVIFESSKFREDLSKGQLKSLGQLISDKFLLEHCVFSKKFGLLKVIHLS